jgi:broad specificity phosphatase PhoE
VVELLERVGRFLAAVAGDPAASRLGVTHPAVVRAAVVVVLGAPPAGFWSIDAPWLASTTLTTDGRRWALRAHGVRADAG